MQDTDGSNELELEYTDALFRLALNLMSCHVMSPPTQEYVILIRRPVDGTHHPTPRTSRPARVKEDVLERMC